MLLRSSSTPVLGSLLSKSISEHQNNHHSHSQSEIPNPIPKHPSTSSSSSPSLHQNFNKLSSKHFTTSLCNSSPVSPSVQSELPSKAFSVGFRRARSDGNLKGLDVVGASSEEIDEFSFSHYSKNFTPRPRYSTLESIPSFSLSTSTGRYEDEDTEQEEEEEDFTEATNASFGNFNHSDGGDVVMYKSNLGVEEGRGEMYLARGLGVCDGRFVLKEGHFGSGLCGGGSGGSSAVDVDGDDGQGSNGIEGHHKRLLEENPCNSLYLRNYASFLYHKKRNLQSAEDYYSRAILEDPKDGEVLSEYAHLVWDLYHDKDRATGYFERAVQASAENSHVHAAFARFLWESEDYEPDSASYDTLNTSAVIPQGVAA